MRELDSLVMHLNSRSLDTVQYLAYCACRQFHAEVPRLIIMSDKDRDRVAPLSYGPVHGRASTLADSESTREPLRLKHAAELGGILGNQANVDLECISADLHEVERSSTIHVALNCHRRGQ